MISAYINVGDPVPVLHDRQRAVLVFLVSSVEPGWIQSALHVQDHVVAITVLRLV